MVAVVCEGLVPQSSLARWVQSLQNRFQLHDNPTSPETIRVRYSEKLADAPWRLHPSDNLVEVSAWRSADLARYAGRSTREYLLLTGMLALTQFRALALNPLLRPVDFIHRCDNPCLFVNVPERPLDNFLLAADKMQLCHGCGQFYCCLGVEPEWLALRNILQFFSNRN